MTIDEDEQEGPSPDSIAYKKKLAQAHTFGILYDTCSRRGIDGQFLKCLLAMRLGCVAQDEATAMVMRKVDTSVLPLARASTSSVHHIYGYSAIPL
jgi:hypothetical protein